MSKGENISKDWLQSEFSAIRQQIVAFEKKSDERHGETRLMVAKNGERITLLETWKNNFVGKMTVIVAGVTGVASLIWGVTGKALWLAISHQ